MKIPLLIFPSYLNSLCCVIIVKFKYILRNKKTYLKSIINSVYSAFYLCKKVPFEPKFENRKR